jgi:hypothetical protein
MKILCPETSPTAYTWPVQSIYVMKEFGPETSSTACTWSTVYILDDKFGEEIFHPT